MTDTRECFFCGRRMRAEFSHRIAAGTVVWAYCLHCNHGEHAIIGGGES